MVNIKGADVLATQGASRYHIILQLVSREHIKNSESDIKSLHKRCFVFNHKASNWLGTKQQYNHNYILTACVPSRY